MQVYFIDNEDYFHRKNTVTSSKAIAKEEYEGNDETYIFSYVMETVCWTPDIFIVKDWGQTAHHT